MGDTILEEIRRLVYETSRLFFTGHKQGLFRRKVEGRMQELCLEPRAYWLLLQRSPQEQRDLVEILTTNETLFFRNRKQFAYLMERIVPQLEEERGRQVITSWGAESPASARSIMTVRVLCAGCSTGEEPYSVAMALTEALRYPKAWDIRIVAGDISDRCLSVARAGHYEEERLKSLPRNMREKYLEPKGGGAAVTAGLRDIVSFMPLNLRDAIEGAPFPGAGPGEPGFDLIFCRNVLIYFSPEGQQLLIEALSRALAPGGYLFTGDAEPLHLYSHELEPVDEAGCLIYRKAETERHATAV